MRVYPDAGPFKVLLSLTGVSRYRLLILTLAAHALSQVQPFSSLQQSSATPTPPPPRPQQWVPALTLPTCYESDPSKADSVTLVEPYLSLHMHSVKKQLAPHFQILSLQGLVPTEPYS